MFATSAEAAAGNSRLAATATTMDKKVNTPFDCVEKIARASPNFVFFFST